MADVAMGETPTYGKIKVNVSPTRPRSPARDPKKADSSNEGVSIDMNNSISSSSKSSISNNSNSNSNNNNANTDSSDGDGTEAKSKAVEWYGTIRLLVFVRKGELLSLSYRTVSSNRTDSRPLLRAIVIVMGSTPP